MAEIRAFVPEDIPAVANLFQKTFRDGRKPAPLALAVVMEELFFEHPWKDPELPSRVYVSPEGKVAGFIGVLPMHMSFEGKPVRAAVPSSIMVDEPEKNPLAGAKLVRAFLGGPQDLSVSEPTSLLAQGMWEKMGGQSVPTESMEWLRLFRPVGAGLAYLATRRPGLNLARPLTRPVDAIARRVWGPALKAEESPGTFHRDADVSDEELFRVVPEFAATYPLHPEWDTACLKWQIDHASRNRTRGTLYRRVVYGRNGQMLGCYLYHGKPGGFGFVVQLLTRPDAAGGVLDSLFAHAQKLGCVAVKGRTQLRLMDALLKRNVFFFRRHSAVAHSRNPELLAAIRSGNSLTIGLAAEGWTRLVGETFH